MAKKKKKKGAPSRKKTTRISGEKPSDIQSWSPFAEVPNSGADRQKIIRELAGLPPEKTSVEIKYRLTANRLVEALKISRDEDLENCVNTLTELTRGSSPSKPAMLLLSWISCFSDVITDPMAGVNNALSLCGEVPDLKRYRAFLLYRSGNKEEALAVFNELASLPDSGDGDGEIADALRANTGFAQGSGFLFPSLDFGSFYHLKTPEDFYLVNYNILLKLIEREPENSHNLFEASLYAFFLGEFKIAESHLNRLLELTPDHHDGLALLGFVREKNNEIDEAMVLYKKVLAQNPAHPLANVNQGICCRKKGNLIGAEYYFGQAVESAPEFPEALSQLARFLVHDEKNSDKIIELHKKAISLDPEVGEYHLHYCLSILRLGDLDKLQSEWNLHKKYIQAFTENDNARRLINRVLAASKDPLYDVGMAEMLNENGFTRPAGVFIVKAWKRKYNVPSDKLKEFYYHAGIQAGSCEEHSISLSAFQNLQELDSEKDSLAIYIAMAYTRLGKNNEALAILDTIKDQSERLGVLKANVFWELGRAAEAIETSTQAVNSQEPSFLSLYYAIKYSLARGSTAGLDPLVSLGANKWQDTPGFWALKAEVLLSMGKASEASEYLKEKLYSQGEPDIPPLKQESGLENNLVEAFYMLGCAFLKQSSFDELALLVDWLDKNFSGAPEWEVLLAERYRAENDYHGALKNIFPTNRSLPANVTRALCFSELENDAQVKANCQAGLKIVSRGKMYYHPCGDIEKTLVQLQKKVTMNSGSEPDPGVAENDLEPATSQVN